MTYDRAIVKLPPTQSPPAPGRSSPRRSRSGALSPPRSATGQSWQLHHHRTRSTDGSPPDFDDSRWQQGMAGSARPAPRARWCGPRGPLRISGSDAASTLDSPGPDRIPHWRIHHDEDAEVYLNGAAGGHSSSGYTSGYQRIPLDARARALPSAAGNNLIAIHVHQTTRRAVHRPGPRRGDHAMTVRAPSPCPPSCGRHPRRRACGPARGYPRMHVVKPSTFARAPSGPRLTARQSRSSR